MPQSLSNLANNLAELNKNLHTATLINRLFNTYKLSDNNIEKLKLLLRKGVYPDIYEIMEKL